MALLSSSYHFTAALPYMGFIPPQQMSTSPNFPLVGLRIPPYFPSAYVPGATGPASIHGFTQSSAFARLSSENNSKLSLRKPSAVSPQLTHRSPKVVDFSIDGILGTRRIEKDEEEDDDHCLLQDAKEFDSSDHSHLSESLTETENKSSLNEKTSKPAVEADNPLARFSWLQCTRYKPPRLPRTKRKDATKKRKLGRNPRVPFSPAQVATLEQKFRCTHYLSSYDVAELSTALNLSENRVKIWFQNRRARERRDKDAVEKSFNPTIIPASPPVSASSPIVHAIPSPPVTSSELHHKSPLIISDHMSNGSPTKSLLCFPGGEKFPPELAVVSSSYSSIDFSPK